MELSIDTSTRVAGVALSDHGQVLAELTWKAEQNHTTELLPAVDHVLRMGRVEPSDLAVVIVATGPGSFSGLRVGVSAAKGLAMSLGLPMAGVGTLEVEAHPFSGGPLPIRPILDAGRGDLATALFASDGAGLREVEAPRVATLQEVIDSTGEPTLFCGEHLPAVRDALVAALASRATIPPPSALMRRSGNLAELGWRRIERGLTQDPATLQPAYLRAPSITRPRPATRVRS